MDKIIGRVRTAEPSFHTVADALGLGMAFQIQVAPDGVTRRFTYVSPRCLEMNGVKAQDALKDPMLLYGQILPDHRVRFEAAEKAALRAMKGFAIEVAMHRADGALRWRKIASSPTLQADGSTLWDGLLIDITDARRDASELGEQRRRLEAAVEATGLGFWEWDVRSGALVWSERNRELFGVGPDEPITIERYLSLVHPEDLERVREAYRATETKAEGGDYSVEHRIAPQADGQVRWIHAQGRVVKDAAGVKLVVGTSLDITKRKLSEERRNLLMGELAHRAKNGIAVMMTLVTQSARRAVGVKDLEEVLLARLQAMAASQDLVMASGGRPVALADVVVQALSPFELGNFDVGDVADVTIMGEVAVGLALLLHEMSTNAVKYGALSAPDGRVEIRRQDTDDGQVALAWTERGGPAVTPSKRQGFGTRVLEMSLRNQGGKVDFDFAPQGFAARVQFPTAR